MIISSKDNKKIKEVYKLKQEKYRKQQQKYIVETLNIIKEAYNEGVLEEIYIREDKQNDIPNFFKDIPIFYVTESVFKKISNLTNSYILGVCKMKKQKREGDKYLLLDGIQDPGNLGTIIRTSLGFNIATIILSDTCVNLYNEKVIMASEGAIFKINIIKYNLISIIKDLKQEGFYIYGTDVTNGTNLHDVKQQNKYALVMGSEGTGVSLDVKRLTDSNIYIKTNEKLESLNVAVATGIILYELNK